MRLPGQAMGRREPVLVALDTVVVIQQVGVHGAHSAAVRVKAVRAMLVSGDHDGPPWAVLLAGPERDGDPT